MTRLRPLLALPLALVSLPAHATTTGVEPGDVEIHIVAPADGAEVSSPVDVVVVEGTGQIWDAEVLVDGVPAAECDLWDLYGEECTMSIPMLLGEHTITVRGVIEGELIDDDSITVTVVAVSDTDGTDSGSGESHGEASDDTGNAEGGSAATESADDGMTSSESDDGATTAAADDGATTAAADDGATGGAGDDGSTTAGGGGAGDDGDEGGASRGCSIGDAGRPLPLLGVLALGLARRRGRSGAQRR